MEDVQIFVEVSQTSWSNSSDCLARLGTNMIELASEMTLYIILDTLEKLQCWNWTFLIMAFHNVKQSQTRLSQPFRLH